MTAPLSPAQIMTTIHKLESAVKAAGPKHCGLSLTQHDWLIGQAEESRRSLSMMDPPAGFDTLGGAAGRVVDQTRERMQKP